MPGKFDQFSVFKDMDFCYNKTGCRCVIWQYYVACLSYVSR